MISKSGKQHGQATVETALLLPPLIVLLLGIFVASFVFYAFVQVTNAAREGARAGSLYRITQTTSGMDLPTTVQDAICNSNTTSLGFLVNLSASQPCNKPSFNVGADVACSLNGMTCTGTSPVSGDQLRVTVTYRYTIPILSVALPMFPQPIVIRRIVLMEVQ